MHLRPPQLSLCYYFLHVHDFCFNMSHPSQKTFDAFSAAKRDDVQKTLREKYPTLGPKSASLLEKNVKEELCEKWRGCPFWFPSGSKIAQDGLR